MFIYVLERIDKKSNKKVILSASYLKNEIIKAFFIYFKKIDNVKYFLNVKRWKIVN